MSPKLFIKLSDKLQKRLIIAVLIILVVGTASEIPNPVTHKCVPNFRTEMHLPSDGYPAKNYFCPEGYYPVLKWGEGRLNSAQAELFFVIIPGLAILPLAFLLTRLRQKR